MFSKKCGTYCSIYLLFNCAINVYYLYASIIYQYKLKTLQLLLSYIGKHMSHITLKQGLAFVNGMLKEGLVHDRPILHPFTPAPPPHKKGPARSQRLHLLSGLTTIKGFAPILAYRDPYTFPLPLNPGELTKTFDFMGSQKAFAIDCCYDKVS